MKHYLDILPDDQSRKTFNDVIDKMVDAHLGMTPFQISQFVLNDVEFPTPYGRWKQARFELVHRFDQLTELYYEIKLTKLEIRSKEREILNTEDDIRKEILSIEIDRERAKGQGQERQLKSILIEANALYAIYTEHSEFSDFSTEDAQRLEIQDWFEKAKNNPVMFEERYGDKFMQSVLEKGYGDYLEHRRQKLGLISRELTRSNGLTNE